MIVLTIFSHFVILSYLYVRFYHFFFVDLVAGTWLYDVPYGLRV